MGKRNKYTLLFLIILAIMLGACTDKEKNQNNQDTETRTEAQTEIQTETQPEIPTDMQTETETPDYEEQDI